VLLLFQVLGTAHNTTIQKYMNENKVPQLFIATGATKWNDPQRFPWTMASISSYQSEEHVYLDHSDTGSFILIDPETGDTIALGIIEAVKPSAVRAATTNLHHLIRSAETHARSIAKAVSWRATGSLDTFVVAALVTGNSKLACGVALAEILAKTALYYVHERAWALIPWGRR
jgi:uncharacterized membrane protein